MRQGNKIRSDQREQNFINPKGNSRAIDCSGIPKKTNVVMLDEIQKSKITQIK